MSTPAPSTYTYSSAGTFSTPRYQLGTYAGVGARMGVAGGMGVCAIFCIMFSVFLLLTGTIMTATGASSHFSALSTVGPILLSFGAVLIIVGVLLCVMARRQAKDGVQGRNIARPVGAPGFAPGQHTAYPPGQHTAHPPGQHTAYPPGQHTAYPPGQGHQPVGHEQLSSANMAYGQPTPGQYTYNPPVPTGAGGGQPEVEVQVGASYPTKDGVGEPGGYSTSGPAPPTAPPSYNEATVPGPPGGRY